MKHQAVTILLPTYNEAGNIIPLIKKILSSLPATKILVIDDNSPDGTSNLVRKFARTKSGNRRVKLLLRTSRRGLTNSLADGIKASKSEIIAWMDCDFSHPPELLPKLLDQINKGADIALATRFFKGERPAGSPPLPILSRILNKLTKLLFGSDINDYTTGFLAAKRIIFDDLVLHGDYGEYCIDLLVRAKAQGLKIMEIPYISPKRRWGKTKTSPNIIVFMKHSLGYLTTVLGLYLTQ